MSVKYAYPVRIIIGKASGLVPSRTRTPVEREVTAWLLEIERAVAERERSKNPR